MPWEAGLARVDITAYEQETRMLGWERPAQRIHGVATPLFARALVVSTERGACFAYACAELCIMSIAVRQAVIERLCAVAPGEWGPHNVLLTATHTHSGPSGYSHHAAYHSNSFGFSPGVFDTVVNGLAEAILTARRRGVPATLRLGETTIPLEEPVAWNRSVDAYNRNREVTQVSRAQPERATDRRSLTLRIDRASDRLPLGVVNWFAVHGTSLRGDNTYLHSDNKGIAAQLFERVMARRGAETPPFVAIFAQGAAGDVAPTREAREGGGVASGDDAAEGLRRVARNGGIQYRYARRAFEAAAATPPLAATLLFATRHVDMACAEVDPDFAGGRRDVRTSQALFGLRTAAGTAEGPGPLRPFVPILDAFTRLRRAGKRWVDPKIDPKVPFLEIGAGPSGRVLGVLGIRAGMPFVARHQPGIAFLHAADLAGHLGEEPWAPRVVPVQVARLGRLVLCAVPGEPTTVSGRALERSVGRAFPVGPGEAPPRVVVNGYSNGYAGYVATRREYELQRYEGSSTLFGEWTLGAYQTTFDALVRRGLADTAGAPVEGPRLCLIPRESLLRQRDSGRAAGASEAR